MSRRDRPTSAPALPLAGLAGIPGAHAAGVAVDDDPPSGVVRRLGGLASVPRMVLPLPRLVSMPLSHREGFIASFVDGTYTVDTILDASGMNRDEALAILDELARKGVIVYA